VAGYLLRRVPSALLVLVLASIAIFGGLRLVPGNAADLLAGPDPTPRTVHAVEVELGLTRPLPVQYLTWLSGVLTGHLGRDYILGGQIGGTIERDGAATIELTAAALIVTIVVGAVLGVFAGVARGPLLAAVNAVVTIFFSVPGYVIGLVLLLIFAEVFDVLPAGGDIPLWRNPEIGIQYLILPAVALALNSAAVVARFLQTSLRAALQEDYVRTAVAKGVSRPRIVLRHALPNALPTVITILGIHVGQLLGGAVLIESIFDWPGLGQYALRAIEARDYLVVQDLVLIGVAVFVCVQLLTDICTAALDPRIALDRS
jgi:peptide/nickel transport system permease protein